MVTTENELRDEVIGLLDEADYGALIARGAKRYAVVRTLIGLTYNLADLRSWRAMEAIGLIAANLGVERTRNLLQRLLWMMREESGSNAWTAGQIIGEIVCRNPAPFADIAPIVISFHEEPLFRAGALWSLYRIGSARPDMVQQFEAMPLEYLDSPVPLVRALAVIALGELWGPSHQPALMRASSDQSPVVVFRDGGFVDTTVGALAAGYIK